MYVHRPCFSRLEEILRRQAGPAKWLGDYQPCNVINGGDNPSATRPAVLDDPYLKRGVHAQAGTEQVFVLLALHHPGLLDLHEQKMLFFSPSPHPLEGHPAARGLQLPGLRGTLAIAEAMGKLKDHIMVRAPLDHPVYRGCFLPFPYVGDLLLYLSDLAGPYATNWSIKRTLEDFHRTHKRRNAPTSIEDREKAEFRHELERLYYLDGLIPTHQLVPAMVDKELSINLLNLYYWHARQPQEPRATALKDEVLAYYREQLPCGRVMHDHTKNAAKRFGINLYDAKRILKSGIFTRQVRVELFRVVADNLPLHPEIHDPLVRYADWFRRLK
jgi:hypothetical protein